MEKDKIWKQIQAELQLILSSAHYKLYFGSSKIDKISKEKDYCICILVVPNSYTRDIIKEHYQKELIGLLEKRLKNKVKIQYKIGFPLSLHPNSNPPGGSDLGPLFVQEQSPKNKLSYLLKIAHLQSYFTFRNFAVSSSNEMAYAAARAVSRTPGKAYNPLFFYGGVGVGKTHLMQAIAQSALCRKLSLKVLYCTGEEFTNEIIEAIQEKRTVNFRKKYRLVDILIIDDVQFIAGKNTVQEEFFHTFNAILHEGGQVIMSSDKPPDEIQKLEERLASRFEAGLIVDIQEPNFELRTAILLIKAKMLSISLPMDVAQLLSSKITSTRQLEGTLIKLKAFTQTQNEAITPAFVNQVLKFDKQEKNNKQINYREIISQVSHYYNLKASQLKGKERSKHIVLPRQIAMFLLRLDAKLSLVEVGKMFGGRDHTTVMHSVDKIENLYNTSEEIRQNIKELRNNLS